MDDGQADSVRGRRRRKKEFIFETHFALVITIIS